MPNQLPTITKEWTLFLDRDGVINKHLPNAYVTCLEEFEFIPGSIEAIAKLSRLFGRIVVVTNQQGIGKGLMTTMDLEKIHFYMEEQVRLKGGRIDAIYYCPHLSQFKPKCRKPDIGMALQAKEDFPSIQFEKSIMVGDSITDMIFGKNIGCFNVFISSIYHRKEEDPIDRMVDSLAKFAALFS